jgi:hypothetical protein
MDDREYIRNLRASATPRESIRENARRKLPVAILAFTLGSLCGAILTGSILGRQVREAETETAQCRAQLAEAQNTATVLLEPVAIELAHGMVGMRSGVLPLAPQWIVPGKVEPQSTAAGRAYLWVGKSGAPQGPFVAVVSAHTGASWVFIPGAGGGSK